MSIDDEIRKSIDAHERDMAERERWIEAGSDPETCGHWLWGMSFPKRRPWHLGPWRYRYLDNTTFTCKDCGHVKRLGDS